MERCIRINAENGQKVGFKITKTVVTDVNPGGLADNAGLRVGDRLVKVRPQRTRTNVKVDEGRPTGSVEAFSRLMVIHAVI